jgi:putative cardiolipin synthase
MHNKSMTFDNQATIVGGRNIGDEYFDARADTNYNDLELFAVGPVVQDVSREFDAYWNSALAVPIRALVRSPQPEELERLRASVRARADEARRTRYKAAFESSLSELFAFRAEDLQWAPWTLVFDPPEKAEPGFARQSEQVNVQLRQTAESARTELVMVSPYFVPRDRGVAWLRSLRQRGVRVVIVTNSLSSTDVLPVHAGYSRSRKALLEAGVELWEIREDSVRIDRQRRGLGFSGSGLHTKAFAVDRRQLFVGSFNLDPRSADINTEMGIVVDSPNLAGSAVDRLLTALPTIAYRLRLDGDGDIEWAGQEDGAEVVYRTEPHADWWRRFRVGVVRLLPIEGQL